MIPDLLLSMGAVVSGAVILVATAAFSPRDHDEEERKP